MIASVSILGLGGFRRHSRDLSSTFERLSSGLRINRASDDAAGQALSDGLINQSRATRQGIRNINDGISIFNTADAALEALSSIVGRQRELATQAANDSYTALQRAALDTEADELAGEYNRIVQSASFNGKNLFGESFAVLNLQAGNSHIRMVGADPTITFTSTTGTGTFQTGLTLPTGLNPQVVASADINGDGKMDLVSADAASNQLSMFLGNGDGTFQAAAMLAVSAGPRSIVTADINGDGKLDLVSASTTAGQLNILLGNGNGTFQAATTLTPGSGARAVTAVDVNGDGKLDLISADPSANRLSVFLGNGNGTFQAATAWATGTAPYHVISVDVNGDGKLDLVSTSNVSSQVNVLLGNGNGTFQAATTLATGPNPHRVAAADVNNDGRIDLVSADSGSNQLSIFLGNGDGTFQVATTLAAGNSVEQVISVDINGDGNIDLVSTSAPLNQLRIFWGNGNGSFKAPTTLTATSAFGVVSADVNGDGVIDLVSADNLSHKLTVLIQNTSTSTTSSLLQSTMDLTSVSGAQNSLVYLSAVSTAIDAARGTVGASLSRLEIALSNLSSTTDLLETAARKILDIDIADEVAKLVRLQVVQQSSTAVLAQVRRLQPQMVTQLLQESG